MSADVPPTRAASGPMRRMAATAFIFCLAYAAGQCTLINGLWGLFLRPLAADWLGNDPVVVQAGSLVIHTLLRWVLCLSAALWTSSQTWALCGRWACTAPLAILYGVVLHMRFGTAEPGSMQRVLALALLLLLDLPIVYAAGRRGDGWRQSWERRGSL